MSSDKHTAIAQVALDARQNSDMPTNATQHIMDTVKDADHGGVAFAVNGQVVSDVEGGNGQPDVFGLIAAVLILLLTFGSVIAAGLPVMIALVGLAISSSLIAVISHAMSVPPWAPSLAAMLGIGVGIDYALLMITRYRENLGTGQDTRTVILGTSATAGRSVMIAGSTVIVSLVGLVLTGLSYLQSVAVSAMIAVALVMLATVTLLPVLLAWAGPRIDKWAIRLRRRSSRSSRSSKSSKSNKGGTSGTSGEPDAAPAASVGTNRWVRWARFVQRHPATGTVVGVVILVALALPVFTVRFGIPDAGNDQTSETSRVAYDWVSDGFGVGNNGPLVLAAQLNKSGDTAVVTRTAATLAKVPGVVAVSPPQFNPAHTAALMTVVPKWSPQSKHTETLVHTLRDTVLPKAVAGTDVDVHVGGPTAGNIDFNKAIVSRLPLLITGVIVLALLLLLAAFRSLAIAVKAAILNLLSIGAAYGVIALALQGGFVGGIVGIDTSTPLPAYIPVLVFAILFGLSMDYEVFLLGRMYENHTNGVDSDTSVATGLGAAGRIITAAAAIMIAVFSSFAPAPNITLKLLGIGLSTAVFVDVVIVRMLLVPAIMRLLGRYAWWLPGFLDRLIPKIALEEAEERASDLSSTPVEARDRPKPVRRPARIRVAPAPAAPVQGRRRGARSGVRAPRVPARIPAGDLCSVEVPAGAPLL